MRARIREAAYTAWQESDRDLRGVGTFVKDRDREFLVGLVELVSDAIYGQYYDADHRASCIHLRVAMFQRRWIREKV